MWRCEEEINLKLSPANVVEVLVRYYSRLSNDKEDEEEIKENLINVNYGVDRE